MTVVKRILFVTATRAEAAVLENNPSLSYDGGATFRSGEIEVILLITGIGSVPTAWSMMNWFSGNGKPDLVINAGIAGSFREEIRPGIVVMPVSEIFADSVIEDNERYLTLSQAGLADPDEFPYRNGVLSADTTITDGLKINIRKVRGITTSTATGSSATHERMIKMYNPDIESMEGASFFYICLRENVPFVALRAISNYTGPRNRKEWKIELALENLTGTFSDFIQKMHN